ncbi:MAG: M48 family metallopeptidase [bacterium]|nr:M48 family metallopeptidase [bacterium]
MKIKYGNKEISFVHRINPKLKHAYVTVDAFDGVVLKSPPMEKNQAKALVRKKAAWIIQKRLLTAPEPTGDIVTGSRIPYLGKKYYTEIIREAPTQKKADALVVFNYSRFKIYLDPACRRPQHAITAALDDFYRQKAIEKITSRFHYWRNVTGRATTQGCPY